MGWRQPDCRETREMAGLIAKQTQPDGTDHNELDLWIFVMTSALLMLA